MIDVRDWRQALAAIWSRLAVACSLVVGAVALVVAAPYVLSSWLEPAEPPLPHAAVVSRPLVQSAPSPTHVSQPSADGYGSAKARPSPGGNARALQTALRRAECYAGPVDGAWSHQSRDAMDRFLTVVNAKLPVDQPDQILVAVVETNPQARCGSGRPELGRQEPAPAPSPSLEKESPEPAPSRQTSQFSTPVPMSSFRNQGESRPTPPQLIVKPDLATQEATVAPIRPQRAEPPRFAPADLAPTPPSDAAPPPRITRSYRATRSASTSYRRKIHRRSSRAGYSNFSRSASRSFRSISRALSSVF